MQAGYGWRLGNRVMRLVHQGNLAAALALIDERHAALHRQRLEVAETERALQMLPGRAPVEPSPRRRATGPDGPDGRPDARWRTRPELLRIGAAARRAGVRASAVRFWEQQGLLRPPRDPESGFRLYDREQLARLHVVAVLRQATYSFEAIGAVLDQLAGGRPDAVLTAIERRRDDLTRASKLCSRGTAALWDYLAAWLDEPAALSGTLPATALAGLAPLLERQA
jgi:DNA-binding transcriptional MerR regulator